MSDATNERDQTRRCSIHWPTKLRADGSCGACDDAAERADYEFERARAMQADIDDDIDIERITR